MTQENELRDSIAAINRETENIRKAREDIEQINAEMEEVAQEIAVQKSELVLKAIDAIRLDTLEVSIGGELAGSELVTLHQRVSAAAASLREIKRLIEDAAIEHIEATGQDIAHPNGSRWYVGKVKTTKAHDDSQVLAAVLEVSGGDLAKLASGENGVLVSSPWKAGALRSLLGAEKFAELFVEKIETDLKTGAAKKALKTADERWQK